VHSRDGALSTVWTVPHGLHHIPLYTLELSHKSGSLACNADTAAHRKWGCTASHSGIGGSARLGVAVVDSEGMRMCGAASVKYPAVYTAITPTTLAVYAVITDSDPQCSVYSRCPLLSVVVLVWW
jgi:hypothetical protein